MREIRLRKISMIFQQFGLFPHKTIIFISHDIYEAFKIGDRIAVMKEGKIVQVGTPKMIITQPANDYIRAFLQDIYDARDVMQLH